jgi:hypothetical protein
MKFIGFLSIPALALQALAQNFTNTTFPPPPPIDVQEVTGESAPFRLQLQSHNRTLNKSFLSAVHEGAALESLGLYPSQFGNDSFNTFKLNTTRIVCNYDNGTEVPCGSPSSTVNTTSIGTPGLLIWDLPYQNSANETGYKYADQVIRLVPRGVSSNMAFAVISFYNEDDEFDSFTGVAFDKDGYMNLQDDVSNKIAVGPNKAYYRWHVCYGWFEYYVWSHLVWVYGPGEPDFLHCDKVDVKRVWA